MINFPISCFLSTVRSRDRNSFHRIQFHSREESNTGRKLVQRIVMTLLGLIPQNVYNSFLKKWGGGGGIEEQKLRMGDVKKIVGRG